LGLQLLGDTHTGVVGYAIVGELFSLEICFELTHSATHSPNDSLTHT